MKQCPYCGRYFKNTPALNAHLRFCPAKAAPTPAQQEEIKEWRFKYLGNIWEITGYPKAMKVFEHADKSMRDWPPDPRLFALIGVLKALKRIGLVKKWSTKPIKS